VCTYSSIMLAAVMNFLLQYDLYNSIPFLFQPSEGVINISVCVLWTIYMLISTLTNTLALRFIVTRNSKHMKKSLCLFYRDCNRHFFITQSKLLTNNSEHTFYSIVYYIQIIRNCFCIMCLFVF
jgi:hypothetical protein